MTSVPRNPGDVSGATSADRAPTRYGFSGARDLTEAGERVVVGVLDAVLAGAPERAEYTTGACVGVDAFVGAWLWRHAPRARHRVVVPADRSRVEHWWRRRAITEAVGPYGVEVEEMGAGTTYKDRNQRIVECSDVLIAFPAHGEDDARSRRSGTWQTVRMARRAGLEVRVFVLGGPLSAGGWGGGVA